MTRQFDDKSSPEFSSWESPPKASLLIESMRDIGYSLETALADVIDNSITAGASKIHIQIDTSGPDIMIGILDNGDGMNREELLDAMRLGSRHPQEVRSRRDLGRFGLGLKTASFSQCRRLTVVARKEGLVSAAIWDLDHVAQEEKWLLLIPNDLEAIPFFHELKEDGALIVWQNLDRAVEQGGSASARTHFAEHLDEARRHLELVFHRYLSGERGIERVEMFINNVPLRPADPFHSNHSATSKGQLEKVQIGAETVEITPFTLPHHRNVTKAEWEEYAGKAGYQKNQGFYLYREKRLIVYGTWFGLARQMELTKLARVRIDIPNGLDAAWHVDVKKASARPPLQVRDRLKRIIEQLGAPSRTIFTQRGTRLHDVRMPIWQRVQEDNSIVYRLNQENPVYLALIEKIPVEIAAEFLRFVEAIGAGLPMDAIFADLASHPESVHPESLTDSTLKPILETTYAALRSAGVKRDVIPEILRVMEPFRSHWDRTEILGGQLFLGETDDK